MGIYETRRLEFQSTESSLKPSESPAGQAGRAQVLRSLADSLLTVARELEGEPGTGREQSTPAAPQPADTTDLNVLLERTRQEYADRRQRRRFFPADLFGEPAWDLLLDLFKARLEGRMITVTSACIAADVPLSTALRWLGVLEEQGLVERRPNVEDQRSTWVRLTDQAVSAMINYIENCCGKARRPAPTG